MYIYLSTINHRIQPLISQLNAILGAPSCSYGLQVGLKLSNYNYSMDPRAPPRHRVHRAQFGRTPPAEGLIEVKNLSKIHWEDLRRIESVNHWSCFWETHGKTIYIYISYIYIYIYIYVGHGNIW